MGNQVRELHLVTVLWGDWYRRMFTDAALPSLLSPANLPGLAASRKVTYTILTTRHDALEIARSPAFTRACDLVQVNVEIHDGFDQGDIFSEQARFRHLAAEAARNANALFATVQPDVVLSNGSLLHAVGLLDQGKSGVYTKSVRVASESFLPDFLETFPPLPDAARVAPPRELARVALRHCHGLNLCQSPVSPDFANFSEFLMWPVVEAGAISGLLITSPFPSDLLFLDPAADFRLSYNHTLKESRDFRDIAVVDDSDQMLVVSLSPALAYNDWYMDRGPMDIMEAAKIASDFGVDFWGDLSFVLGARKFRLHCGDLGGAPWRAAEWRSSLTMHRLLTYKRYHNFWKTLRSNGAVEASRLLALLMESGHRLPGGRYGGPLTILVPADEGFSFASELAQCTDHTPFPALIRRLKSHICLGPRFLGESTRELVALDGTRYPVHTDGPDITVGGLRVIRANVEVGSSLLHLMAGSL